MTTKSNPQLEFISSHHPSLDDGDYTIEISQTISGTGITDTNSVPKLMRRFSVFGERFSLKPSDIHAVFPPDRSLGEYSAVLPHVILNRSTLPWERKIEETDKDAPWLALLLFTEEELKNVQPKVVTIGELKKASADPYWPNISPEAGQADSDSVTVIDIPLATAKLVVPTGAELPHLAHVRQVSGEKETAENSERAVIIGSRLPVGSEVMVAHLVSVENRYNQATKEFIWPTSAKIKTVRLVTLKSWSFQCKSPLHTFGELLNMLDAGVLKQSPLMKITQSPAQAIREIKSKIDEVDRKLVPLATQFSKQLEHGDDIRQVYAKLSPLRRESQLLKLALKAARNHQFQNIPVRMLLLSASEAKLMIKVVAAQAGQFNKSLYQKIRENHGPLVPTGNGMGLKDPMNKLIPLTQSESDALIEQLRASNMITDDETHLVQNVLSKLRQPAKYSYLEQLGRIPQSNYPQMLQGKIPLPHKMRSGSVSYCWYGGPLSPLDYADDTAESSWPTADEFPQKTADNLLRYDKTHGMFDVTYAAAWELGRLLALKDKAFSIDLYKWKRAHSQALRQVEEQELHPHKPHTQHPKGVLLMPKAIEAWLSRLSQLHSVPYNYLVPDDTMLPKESLRFFTVDPRWIACLVDGAFSIGRVAEADLKQDATRKKQISTVSVSGFLLRSAVVSGWPSLQINGYQADGKTELIKLRMERLSPNVLLCLFAGSLKKLTIHEKPETIHFGFDPDAKSSYVKKLRSSVGIENAGIKVKVTVEETTNRVKMDALFTAIEEQFKIKANAVALGFDPFNELNGAQFAMEMVAGVSSVTWQLR